MQGLKRRFVYAGLYELFAIILTSISLFFLANSDASKAGIAGLGSSLIALFCNLFYNAVFEYWESKQKVKGRSTKRRIAHAIGFEITLIILLVPFFAWLFEVSLLQAFLLDIWIIIFFLVYTYFYNLLFDRIFGLPSSAAINAPESSNA